MGILRTSILLISVVLGVGGLLAAMVAGGGLFQSNEVSSSIKPSYSPVLLPPLLHGRLGGMVPLPSRSSRGGGAVHDNFNRRRTSLGVPWRTGPCRAWVPGPGVLAGPHRVRGGWCKVVGDPAPTATGTEARRPDLASACLRAYSSAVRWLRPAGRRFSDGVAASAVCDGGGGPMSP